MNKDDQETLSLLELEIADLSKSVQELKVENMVLKRQLEALYELTGHPPPAAT